jgi:putative colanic acid biosynthesis glycosyltransferase WcaI
MDDSLDVLFLCHHYPPEMGGGATRFDWLTRRLGQLGHRVHVLTGMPNYPLGVILPGYWGKLYLSEQINGLEIRRCWVFAAPFDSRWKRLANYLSFVVSSVVACVLDRRHYDIIIAASPPLFVAVAGAIIARLYHLPWVMDIGDLWPGVAVEAGELAANGLVTRWAYRMAAWLYRDAAYLTPVTDSKRTRLMAAGLSAEKIVVIENAYDADSDTLQEAQDWRKTLELDDRFVMLYAGLIGIAQGVETLIEVAHVLRDRPQIQFLIVGEGVRKADMVQRAMDMQLDNITFLAAQPRAEILSLLRAADVVWVPLANNQIVDAVPSKLMEAWGCGKPVILSAAGESASLVEKAAGGFVVAPGQTDGLIESVLTCFARRRDLPAYGESGRAFVRTHFDPLTLAQRMDTLLRQGASETRLNRAAKRRFFK